VKKRLIDLRKKHGYKTRDDLVEKIKAGKSSVSQWERGEKLPSIKDGLELAELYGVSLDYLYLGNANLPDYSQVNITNGEAELILKTLDTVDTEKRQKYLDEFKKLWWEVSLSEASNAKGG